METIGNSRCYYRNPAFYCIEKLDFEVTREKKV